ncbi:MAG: heme biosynthesis HemY N-terminal domain-containing protein [Gammaproteobacteria bacterium]|nr:heme biosynthesis HemY N-terminal domain-containing protein [Gammaproteobacteria bacterium]
MIRLFSLSLFIIAGALWSTLVLGFPSDPGYLLIAFGKHTFETSLLAFLILILIFCLLIKLVVMIFVWINPGRFLRLAQSFDKRIKANNKRDTLSGLLYFARGNWRSSYSLLTKSITNEEEGIVNYLAAAYAAYRADQFQDSLKCLEEAERRYPEKNFTINLVKSRLLYDSGQAEEAALVLAKIQKVSPNDLDFLVLAKYVLLELKSWREMGDLLPRLKKAKIITSGEEDQIRVQILIDQLDKIWSERKGESEEAIQLNLKDLWKTVPKEFRFNEQLVKNYVSLLIKANAQADALKILELAINKKWSDALITDYGKQDFKEEAHQLAIAEKWIKKRPDDSNLLLCLGRISIKNKLWIKAKSYLERSINILPSAEGYGELSRLFDYLGDSEKSGSYMQSYFNHIGAQLSEISPAREKES